MVVFDTDFVVGIMRADEDALNKYDEYSNEEIFLSAITWYELMRGCCKVRNKKQQLSKLIDTLEGAGVIHFDDTVATIAARNNVILERKGAPTGLLDSFIAASCIANNDVLVTRNTKHFENIAGLKLTSW